MKSSKIILTIHREAQKTSIVDLHLGQEKVFTLGSQQAQVEIWLDDPRISRIHAQLIWDGQGNCLLIDHGSTNGSFLNGKRLPAQLPQPLLLGMRIAFGAANGPSISLQEAPADSLLPPIQQPQKAAPTLAQAPTDSLRSRLARKPELILGRQESCDVVLQGPTISRMHAMLRQNANGSITLIDLDSTNGVYLNGQRILGHAVVQAQDKILIGRNLLSLDEAPSSIGSEIAIRTESIEKVFKGSKVGLQATSLSIPSGSMVAIMGPSGCGKSTLLKCLTGESPPSRGKVYLQNLELVQHYPFLKTLIGYVPQDDSVHAALTVEQALYYAARLRMERPSALEIQTKVDEVLQQLKIAHIRQSRIAKISGGQRKRVSIAVELLTDPLILFLDEPTSPLDPQTIEEFLQILRSLADKGTTVVMVTHKPEDLEYMDRVLFMAEGGTLVYDGPASDYRAYFQVRSAVEVFAAISGPQAQHWIQQFAAQHQFPAAPAASKQGPLPKQASREFWKQTYWLSARYLRIKTNDRLNLAILLGQAPIIALLICMIFGDVTRSVPFMVTLSAIWFGTSNAAREIVSEAAIYRRERMFKLRIGSYLLSKIAVLAGFGAMQALLFSVIIQQGFAGSEPAWHGFSGTFAWVWFLVCSANLLGLLLSAIVDSSEKAMSLVPLVLIPQVMLAGVVTPLKAWPVEWLSYLSPSRWGNEGLLLLQGDIKREISSPLDTSTTIGATQALREQFSMGYEDLFGALAYTVTLDGLMLLYSKRP